MKNNQLTLFDLKQYEVERGSLLADYAFDLDGSESLGIESISNRTDDSIPVKNNTELKNTNVVSNTPTGIESFLLDRDDSIPAVENPGIESFDSDVSKKVCKDFSNDINSQPLENDSIPDPDPHGCINVYWAGGTARGRRQYFRYSYKVYGKSKHVHIRGGSISSSLARARASQVNGWIAQKLEPREIVQLISRFGKGIKP